MRNRRNWTWGVALAATVVVAAGCEDTTGPVDGFGSDDAAFAALVTDELAGSIVFGLMAGGPSFGLGANAGEARDFSRERDCPGGGTVSIAGTVERVQHGDGAVSIDVNGAGAWNECTHSRTRDDVTITSIKTGNFTIVANRKHNNGQPVGNQTSTKAGSFHWTRTNGTETREGDCDFNVTSVRNPDAQKVRITGEICGRTIDREINWKRGT